MQHKIAVQRDTILSLVQMHPLRFHSNHALSLLQEQNVRYYTGSGVGKECIVRQTNGPQQLRPLGQVLPHLGALAVHGVSAGNKGHHAAGPHLIQGFGQKIIVDAEAQRIIAFVIHQVVAEGHVANGKIIKIPPVCGFKARHGNVRIGIELLCNPPGNAVQLHAVQPGAGHMIWKHPEKVAHAAGWLQNIAGGKTHALNGLIDTPNHCRAGVMSVEHGFPRCLVFLILQQLFQLGIFAAPGRVFRIKGLGHSAPAHITG